MRLDGQQSSSFQFGSRHSAGTPSLRRAASELSAATDSSNNSIMMVILNDGE